MYRTQELRVAISRDGGHTYQELLLLFMETKWSSLVSYGMTVDALTDFLPLEVTPDVKFVESTANQVVSKRFCEKQQMQ